MPVLQNPKHETFAQGLASGKPASEAYVDAGYKPNDGNSIRLKGNERIRARVDEIVSRTAEKAEWSAADRLRTLSEIVERTAKEDPRVAVSAIGEANKMQGSHAPAKAEITGKDGGAIQTEDVTGNDLARRIAMALSGDVKPSG